MEWKINREKNILKTAAVVVLYNPVRDVLVSINSYWEQIEKIYVVDNSESQADELLLKEIQSMNKTEYICNHGNYGIAAALNIGAKKAIQAGFTYLLTMDQDSLATPGMVGKLLKCLSTDSKIAIAAPVHQIQFKQYSPLPGGTYGDETTVMTSGNILLLSAYNKIGGFNEDMFIDYIDHEYCIRLKENNYKIVRVKDAVLYHSVGKTAEKRFGFRKVYPSNHSPVRLYYQTRNRFYLKSIYKNKYRSLFKEDMMLFRNSLIKIFIFEKKKIEKYKMVIRGYMDYRKKKLGRYQGK